MFGTRPASKSLSRQLGVRKTAPRFLLQSLHESTQWSKVRVWGWYFPNIRTGIRRMKVNPGPSVHKNEEVWRHCQSLCQSYVCDVLCLIQRIKKMSVVWCCMYAFCFVHYWFTAQLEINNGSSWTHCVKLNLWVKVPLYTSEPYQKPNHSLGSPFGKPAKGPGTAQSKPQGSKV